MSREWKPGDVALVECSDGEWRRAMYTEGYPAPSWIFADGMLRRADDTAARPLVVIDPEDRERVERLVLDYIGGSEDSYKTGLGGPVEWMQAALREYANPTPPKPAEPQGLGAVVEDAGGRKWVRDIEAGSQNAPWFCAPAGKVSRREWWIAVDAVRVLSEGVTP